MTHSKDSSPASPVPAVEIRPETRHYRSQGYHPDTQMMNYGYDPMLSEGAVKPPVFLTSTFVFPSAEAGRDFFDYVSGRRKAPEGEEGGLVYSRFNNPNAQIVEERLAVYEGAEVGVVFSSGMAAIFTSLLAFVRPGDVILHSQPLYGGTETLLLKTMGGMGVKSVGFSDGTREKSLNEAADKAMKLGSVPVIFVETPANPTNAMVDLALVRKLAERIGEAQGKRPMVMCDNTLLGPVFQHPLKHGADLSLYSLTKYVGGHSDLVAGAVLGSKELATRIRALRSAIGTNPDPHTCWMLLRSLETLGLRMQKAGENAQSVADFLAGHHKVKNVHFVSFFTPGSSAQEIYARQCTGAGSTFSFDIEGGQEAAFKFLNNLKLFKLAVSLGGTESLACHPASTTHSGVAQEVRDAIGVTGATIRLSIGIENVADLVSDIRQALER